MQKHSEAPLNLVRWYAASAIFVTRLLDRPQGVALVEERIYLIKASSHDELWEKAVRFAKDEENKEAEFKFDGHQAIEEFIGVRRIISVRRHSTDDDVLSNNIGDGSELIFSYMDFKDNAQLERFMQGSSVDITYRGEPKSESY